MCPTSQCHNVHKRIVSFSILAHFIFQTTVLLTMMSLRSSRLGGSRLVLLVWICSYYIGLLGCYFPTHFVVTAAETTAAAGTCESTNSDDPEGTCAFDTTTTINNNSHDEKEESCIDSVSDCVGWSSQGECDANPNYMLVHCQKSCYVCGADVRTGLPLDGSDLGVPQQLGNNQFGVTESDAFHRMERIRRYMNLTPVAPDIKAICLNRKSECINWAVSGECQENQLYMNKECAPACFSCEYLAIEQKCPVDLNARPDVWEAGDLNAMFEKLTTEPYASTYSVKVLSSPETDGPWVIQMDNVLTPEEANHMIELGGTSR